MRRRRRLTPRRLPQPLEERPAHNTRRDGGSNFPGITFGTAQLAYPAPVRNEALSGTAQRADGRFGGRFLAARNEAGVGIGWRYVQVGAEHGINCRDLHREICTALIGRQRKGTFLRGDQRGRDIAVHQVQIVQWRQGGISGEQPVVTGRFGSGKQFAIA